MKHHRKLFLALFAMLALAVSPVLAHNTTVAQNDAEGVVDSAGEVHAIHDDLHDGEGDGHLPAKQENVELVGKAPINNAADGRVADVTAYGNYAYLTVRDPINCFGEDAAGVAIFDISDPTKPKQVGFVDAIKGSQPGEGAQIFDMKTKHFTGQVLVFNNELCALGGEGGVSLVDVTDPLNPEYLVQNAGDIAPTTLNGNKYHQIHSAFAWQAGDRAYVVMTDNEERNDVDILDITDPRNPVLVGDFDLNTMFPQIIQEDLGSAESFLHDMVVKKIKGDYVMLLSYWDGGYVTLNVNDPSKPTYIADSDFTNPDPERAARGHNISPEGNGHQAEFSHNNKFIIGADEDFSPYRVVATNTTDNREFSATQGTDTPKIDADTSIAGQLVFVGLACNTASPVPAGNGSQIAVAERGVCAFTEKVKNIEAAGGYVGVIIFNREGSDACSALLTMNVQGKIPALFVGRDVGLGFFGAAYDEKACLAGSAQSGIPVGTVGDSVSIEAIFDGWGYVHLFDANLNEIDTYSIPEAQDPKYAEGYGDLSVHEIATDPNQNLGYLSYYAGGLRVIRFSKDGIQEVGAFIDEDGNNFWGVEAHRLPQGKETLILASDRDYGLYIFRYTGKDSKLEAVSPVLECVKDNGGGSYTAWFGYLSKNSDDVTLPIGPNNRFVPGEDVGQPTSFEPGRKVRVFSVDFNGSNLVWQLSGRTATASSNSKRCGG